MKYGTRKMLIGGEWTEGAKRETFPTINPANREVLAEVARGSEADIDHAVEAAQQALNSPAWADIPCRSCSCACVSGFDNRRVGCNPYRKIGRQGVGPGVGGGPRPVPGRSGYGSTSAYRATDTVRRENPPNKFAH